MADIKLDEIRSFLKQSGCYVTVDDLKTPGTEITIKIYCTFLNALGVSTDYLNQVPFHVLPDSDHYQDIIPLINLTQLLNLILSHIGYPNKFYLDDLLNPKPKKNRVVFTHLYQYSLYWQEKMQTYIPFVETFKEKQIQEERMSSEIERIKSEINECQAQIQELNPNVLVEHFSDSENQLAEATKLKEKYSAEKLRKCNELDALTKRFEELKTEQVALPNVIQDMESKILPSMEKLEEELEKLSEEVTVWNSRCEELRTKAAQFDIQLKTAQAASKIDGVFTLDKKIYTHACDILDKMKKLSDNEKLIKAKKSETMEFEKRAAQQIETLSVLRQQNEKQLRRFQRQIETKETEVENAHVPGKKMVGADLDLLEEKKLKLVQQLEKEETLDLDRQQEFQANCQQLEDVVVQDAEDWSKIVNTVRQDLDEISDKLQKKCQVKMSFD